MNYHILSYLMQSFNMRKLVHSGTALAMIHSLPCLALHPGNLQTAAASLRAPQTLWVYATQGETPHGRPVCVDTSSGDHPTLIREESATTDL